MNAFAFINSVAAASRLRPASDFGHDDDLQSDRYTSEDSTCWDLRTFAGRLSELSGEAAGAPLSLILRLMFQAQMQSEPTAWITNRNSTFFPPDAAVCGIDLAALAVIRTRDILAAARAAEHLLRSAAFGLLVLDLGADARLPLHVLARLAGQARHHETALVCLTEKAENQASLGSLVSLRVHTKALQRQGRGFRCRVHALKDKRRGPGWSYAEVCRGPDGLR